MTLALTAKLTALNGPAAVVAFTGALGGLPVGSPVYTSSFGPSGAGVDGFTSGTDGPLPSVLSITALSAPWLTIGPANPTDGSTWKYAQEWCRRTVTGLTGGQFYRVTAEIQDQYATGVPITIGVQGIGAGTPGSGTSTGWTTISYVFTASSTSHVLELRRLDTGVGVTIRLRNVVVQRMSTLTTGVTVQRTDRNGSHTVRQPTGFLPDAAGAGSLLDEEFALPLPGSPVTYTMRDASGATATATLINFDLSSTFAWPENELTPVGFPGQTVQVERVDTYGESYEYAEGTSSSLVIIGRSDPIAISRTDDVWTMRSGSLTMYAATYDDAEDIAAAYQVGRVALLRFMQRYPRDLYHVPTSVRIDPSTLRTAGWSWEVSVDYTEVAWPLGDLQGSDTFTWADVAAGYLAWFNVVGAFPTWADVVAGP